MEQCGSEDKSDDPEATDEAESSFCNVEESVKEQGKVDVQLEAENDDIVKLKQMLGEARLEIARMFLGRDLELNWSGNLTRMSTFILGYHLLLFLTTYWSEYLSPDGRCYNIVYQATAKKWASDCAAGAEPGEAKWRDLDSQVGRPASLSQADELFLMLVRLHLNLKEYNFAQCFEISQSSVSRIFQLELIIVIFTLECFLHDTINRDTMPAIFKEQ